MARDAFLEGIVDRDLQRQIVTVLTYVGTVIVNVAAVVLPLGGVTTAELSDRFPVLVTPANYVFGIWSVIYLLLLVFTVAQALPAMRPNATLRRLGYLPALTGILNALWVLLWQFQVFLFTVPVMLALLVTLIVIHRRLREPAGTREAPAFGWLVVLPFSVYLGWITVATIANIAQMLYLAGYRGWPLGEEAWAVFVLAVGLGIAATMVVRERDVAYGAVIVWACAGIAVKQSDVAVAAWMAAGCAVVVAVLIIGVVRGRLPGGARPSGGPATEAHRPRGLPPGRTWA
ncbi:MAG: tryptophan-rich sensory protein, partial [Chloroflexi bacterium]|nr:tryptophan-rich sensory protein [Chloroflexota bacterium]